jgi:threonine synthase
MKFYNLSNPGETVSLKQAVLHTPADGFGLYMPLEIPALPPAFFEALPRLNLVEAGLEVAHAMLGGDVEAAALRRIVEQALNFEIPLRPLHDNLAVLELFHGPTLAFKDVGARFMAGLFAYFMEREDRECTILVATSGDTGSAVASAFWRQPGIRVVILYPSGKVSPLQEKQLTTMGENITALEINGTFDDCQRLVKQAFGDPALQGARLTSANSINFARLFPQSFYYFHAWGQLPEPRRPVVFCVPSGNFGNLTAGLLAKRMGLPVHHYVAATNANDAVPRYLATGLFEPKPSVTTLSNAMDVGNPSNFPRMLALYGGSYAALRKDVTGEVVTEAETRATMQEVYHRHGYLLDPHGAVGYAALQRYLAGHPDHQGLFLETAHPAKFIDVVEGTVGVRVELPEELARFAGRAKRSIRMENEYEALKGFLSN